MDFASSIRAATNWKDGKGLLRLHLWCLDDLPRLWDKIENKNGTYVWKISLAKQNLPHFSKELI